MLKQVLRPNFEKRDGLVTVVVQDYQHSEILMVAYANEEAWRKTLKTGIATLFSTSRGKLWTKGEESGNFMKIVDMVIDCDGDALIYLVEMQGNKVACHTEAKTCFYRSALGDNLNLAAPKAGPKEELPLVELEVHEDIF